jgi:hypothetical protein
MAVVLDVVLRYLSNSYKSTSRNLQKQTKRDNIPIHKYFIQTPDLMSAVTYDAIGNIVVLPVTSRDVKPWVYDGDRGTLATQYGGLLMLDNCANPTTARITPLIPNASSCSQKFVMSQFQMQVNSYQGSNTTTHYLLLGQVDPQTKIMTFGLSSDPNNTTVSKREMTTKNLIYHVFNLFKDLERDRSM